MCIRDRYLELPVFPRPPLGLRLAALPPLAVQRRLNHAPSSSWPYNHWHQIPSTAAKCKIVHFACTSKKIIFFMVRRMLQALYDVCTSQILKKNLVNFLSLKMQITDKTQSSYSAVKCQNYCKSSLTCTIHISNTFTV